MGRRAGGAASPPLKFGQLSDSFKLRATFKDCRKYFKLAGIILNLQQLF